MTSTLILIIILYLAAMAFIVAEICTPSFGLLGVCSAGCMGWALYLCWQLSPLAGIILLIVTLVVMPFFIVKAVKTLPHTALGQTLYLFKKPVQPGQATPEADQLDRFVGRTTTAETILRPSGTIRIEGKRIVAQAESGMIDKDQQVKVISSAGNRVVVRKIDEN